MIVISIFSFLMLAVVESVHSNYYHLM